LHADVEEFVSLEDLFRFSDVVTVHTQLDKDNAGIIDLSLLSLMKREAILINTGRGGLINERDLEVAVRDGVLAGAALDVLNEEPPPVDHPFFKLHNIIITPHNAWATVEARQRLMQMAADQLKKLVISQ
jgi:glycerate dehydrogenase